MGLEAVYKILNFDEYLNRNNFLEVVFGQKKDDVISGSLPVILFCASNLARDVLPIFNVVGVNPIFFCDSQVSGGSETFCGLPVISIDKLTVENKKSLIIIMSTESIAQKKQVLVEHGFNSENIIEPNQLYFYIEKGSILPLILQTNTSKEEKDLLINIFGEYREKVIENKISVVLFGAGDAGKSLLALLNSHGVNPICFCDNKVVNKHDCISGLPVISFSTLEKEHKNSIILICTSSYVEEISQQLFENNFSKRNVIIIDPEFFLFYANLGKAYLSARILTRKK